MRRATLTVILTLMAMPLCASGGESAKDWLNNACVEAEKVADEEQRLALFQEIIGPLGHVDISSARKIIAKYSKSHGDQLKAKLAEYQLFQGDFNGAIATANSFSDKGSQWTLPMIATSMYRKEKNVEHALELAERTEGFSQQWIYLTVFTDLVFSGKIDQAKKLAPKIEGVNARVLTDNYIRLGELFQRHDDFRPVAGEVMDILDELGETPVRMAEKVGMQGNTAFSIRLLELVERPEKPAEVYFSTSQAYYRIAISCLAVERKEECRELLSKGLADAKMIESPDGRAFKLLDIAGLQADELGDYANALETADLATEAAVKIEDFDQAKALCHIARVQITAEDLPAAEKTLKLAMAANEKYEGNILVNYMADSLVHHLLALGKEEEAHKIAAEAPETDRDRVIETIAVHYSTHGQEKALDQYLNSLISPRERVVAYIAVAHYLVKQGKKAGSEASYSWLNIWRYNDDHAIEIEANGKLLVSYPAIAEEKETRENKGWTAKQFSPVAGENRIVVRFTLRKGAGPKNHSRFQLHLNDQEEHSAEMFSLLSRGRINIKNLGYAEISIKFKLGAGVPAKITTHFRGWNAVNKNHLLIEWVRTRTPHVRKPVSEEIRKWYSTGQMMSEEKRRKDKIISGKYFNRQGKQTGQVVNGTGVKKDYYDNGQVRFECPLVNSGWHGRVINYYPSGQIHAIRECLRDHSNGQFLEYYETGELHIEGINRGTLKKEGQWLNHDKTGKVVAMVTYKGGQVVNFVTEDREDGEFVEYHPNGKVRLKGAYDRGWKTGPWIEYDDSGNIVAVAEFQIGQVADFAGR